MFKLKSHLAVGAAVLTFGFSHLASASVLVGQYPVPDLGLTSFSNGMTNLSGAAPPIGITIQLLFCESAEDLCSPQYQSFSGNFQDWGVPSANWQLVGGLFTNLGTLSPSTTSQVLEATAASDPNFAAAAALISAGARKAAVAYNLDFGNGTYGFIGSWWELTGVGSVGSTVESIRLTLPSWELTYDASNGPAPEFRVTVNGGYLVQAFGQGDPIPEPNPVPEPGTLGLVAVALVGIRLIRAYLHGKVTTTSLPDWGRQCCHARGEI